jgi:hypothetical protein
MQQVGNKLIVKGIVNNQLTLATVTSVAVGSFQATVPDDGYTGGNLLSQPITFAPALGFTHTGAVGSISGGVVSTGIFYGNDIQLLSIRVHCASNTRTGTTYLLVIPASVTSSSGSVDTMYVPIQQVRQDAASLVAVGNTITSSPQGSDPGFLFGALPAAATGVIILASF